ncbi:MAG: Rap1a/Tai family immunity protein [Gammaproteobacteria bacterium]|nr:Rap1a/Tai family immunity protein [Gammaproteobacteria bacterium]
MFFRFTAAVIAVLGFSVSSAPAIAEETAGDWKDGCAAYIGMLREGSNADDVQITWCVATSLGVSQGLATGSQIGAVSMASALVVNYDLDQQEVFAMFSERNPASLLQICMPRDTGARAKIEAVYDYLEANPAQLEQPIAAAFFEGLQARWPCTPPP